MVFFTVFKNRPRRKLLAIFFYCFHRGTDGSIFHPGVTKSDVLHVFNRDLCRSLPLVFQEEVEMNGIPGYR